MTVWKTVGLGLLGLVAIGVAIGESIRATAPPRPPETEDQLALEQCNVAMWVRYGHGAVTGPGSDVWRVKRTGGIAALYTVEGQNSFARLVTDTVECEVSRDQEGQWRLPFLWNVTAHGGKLDPGSIDRGPSRSKRATRHEDQSTSQIDIRPDGTESVTVSGGAR